MTFIQSTMQLSCVKALKPNKNSLLKKSFDKIILK